MRAGVRTGGRASERGHRGSARRPAQRRSARQLLWSFYPKGLTWEIGHALIGLGPPATREVKPDQAKVQRSKITGQLRIDMPLLHPGRPAGGGPSALSHAAFLSPFRFWPVRAQGQARWSVQAGGPGVRRTPGRRADGQASQKAMQAASTGKHSAQAISPRRLSAQAGRESDRHSDASKDCEPGSGTTPILQRLTCSLCSRRRRRALRRPRC